jgi:undecaprenyl diphosphate synthase
MQESQGIPTHVAIIMDGNGRWAKRRLLPRAMGHRAGAKAVRRAIEFCVAHHISYLTLFALSVENRRNRPEKELQFLLGLFLESLRRHVAELHENNIRIQIVGDRTLLTSVLRQHVEHAELLTRFNTGLQLMIAIDYSGRWDIVQAAQCLAAKGILSADITEELFAQHLCFSDVPEPDLLIRTSGEQRISNFMLWQCAYTEFYVTDKCWPDFDDVVFQELHRLSPRS